MKKRSREDFSIDMAPLIDVVFILLVFFMVSTVFKKNERTLLLNLPQTTTASSQSSKVERLNIELTKNSLAINGKTVSFKIIDQLLESQKNKTVSIDLRIDKSVEYARVIKVLDKLKKHGLNNLSLITAGH